MPPLLLGVHNEFTQAKIERDLEEKIDNCEENHTPVSIIVHDIDFINRRLRKAQYFFTDIKKEGVILYNSHKCQLNETKELLPTERKKLAQDDFDYFFEKADKFYRAFQFMFDSADYNEAAFLLHQVTERLYTAILLVFTHYKPNTHDLSILRKLTNSLDGQLAQIFPLDNLTNKRLFTLLRKAYVDARYKRDYKITKEELHKLSDQVKKLQMIGRPLCQKKMYGTDELVCA